jgi:hypothetical protein
MTAAQTLVSLAWISVLVEIYSLFLITGNLSLYLRNRLKILVLATPG